MSLIRNYQTTMNGCLRMTKTEENTIEDNRKEENRKEENEQKPHVKVVLESSRSSTGSYPVGSTHVLRERGEDHVAVGIGTPHKTPTLSQAERIREEAGEQVKKLLSESGASTGYSK